MMRATLASLIWGSPGWLVPALVIAAVLLALVVRSYRHAYTAPWVSVTGALLKVAGIAVLVVCLLEPLYHGTRPRPGANLFVVLADTSRSLGIRDAASSKETRGDALARRLRPDAPWLVRLGQDFDVRSYTFDRRTRAVDDFAELAFDGDGSALASSLAQIVERYRGRPLAGVLVFTDGNSTDRSTGGELAPHDGPPPIYPVAVGSDRPLRDVGIGFLRVSQTSFEAAPVSVEAEITRHGVDGEEIEARIVPVAAATDTESTTEESETVRLGDSGSAGAIARFQLRPRDTGMHFYRVEVDVKNADGAEASSAEATSANNSRLIAVDRTRGPYRVLYVSGRPNWEFKFLHRAIAEDDEVRLVGLVRIAKREPKFEYRSRYGESTNPLFRGFGREDDEDAERYDEPVLLRLGTEDDDELRDGFPKSAETLFRYHAVILDDVEAEYFTQDQMTLLSDFVSRRGGGLLMLGGQESFAKGGYARTPIGELLPVYVDGAPAAPVAASYRLDLTREGWIEPWVRLRRTETGERARLEAMPAFATLNHVRGIKPGASVVARVRDRNGKPSPALVAQRFGRGRAAALLLGDTWKWSMRRKSHEENDHAAAWRQMLRWLVADVPKRVEARIERAANRVGHAVGGLRIVASVRDESYEALDNAVVTVRVTPPDGKPIELRAEASETDAGEYEVAFVPRETGPYRALLAVAAADGSEVDEAETGWATDPSASEFERLTPNVEALERLAKATGGERIEADELDDFVASLPDRRIPIVEPWIYPLWNRWAILAVALCLLCGEWALRRMKGLP